MVNSIEGIKAIDGDEYLVEADYVLFLKELEEAGELKVKGDVKLKELNDLLKDALAGCNERDIELTLKESVIEELKETLSELSEKLKNKYIEEEVKQRVSHIKADHDFYKKRYEQSTDALASMSSIVASNTATLTNAYENVIDFLDKKGLLNNSVEVSEVAKEFAKNVSPKVIIPAAEIQDN